MIILGLDTTTDQASVAIRRAGVTVAEEIARTTDGHSHLLFQMIEAALARCGATLSQIDCFATASGPGSFTGVRLCMTAAKGLAEASGKPAIGISNLRALASFGTAPLRNPIIDARRGQIYTAVYSSDLLLVSDEMLTTEAEWQARHPDAEVIDSTPPLAAAIAYCADLDGPATWHDPALLDAHYVRRSDAEMHWTDTHSRQS